MNLKSKLKLFCGLVAVTAICAGLFLYMDYSSAKLGSTSAVMKSNSITVGADYAGTIVEQFVKVGDRVEAGQKLFYLKSGTLVQALNSNQVKQNDLPYELTDDNELIISASSAGYVSSIGYTRGSYVPMSSQIATIATDNTMTVTAKYRMTPTQYSETTSNSPLEVILPDSSTVTARITNIAIDGQSNPLLVTITAVVDGSSERNVKSGQEGTPVATKLTLKQSTYWDRIADWGATRFGKMRVDG